MTIDSTWISTPVFSSSFAPFLRELVAERGQDLLAAVEQDHPDPGRVDPPEVALERPARELGELAGDLDACRPAAHDDEGHPRLALLGIVCQLGHLERTEDPLPLLDGVAERLHTRRPLLVLVVPEVRAADAGPDDQAVVGELDVSPARLDDGDLPRLEVEPGHLAHLDGDVVVLSQHVARRRSDLSLGEDARRHLVEERLEQVVVDAVDQRYLDRGAPEELCGEEPTEAGPDDDHAVPAGRRHRH